MTSKHRQFFTEKEADYVRRAAGKVPATVIAAQINRPVKSVYNYCERRFIDVRVPLSRLRKYWPDYVPANWRKNGNH